MAKSEDWFQVPAWARAQEVAMAETEPRFRNPKVAEAVRQVPELGRLSASWDPGEEVADPALRDIGRVFAAQRRRHAETMVPFSVAFPEGVARSLAQDLAAAEPPCEHQWVLAWRKQYVTLLSFRRPRYEGIWVCQCGEAKVVEYEV